MEVRNGVIHKLPARSKATIIRTNSAIVDFLKLVVISFMIASPVAWWCMHTWLQDYTYRVSISWWIFVLTGLISVLIAIATVSYQAVKAALANPVKSLRAE